MPIFNAPEPEGAPVTVPNRAEAPFEPAVPVPPWTEPPLPGSPLPTVPRADAPSGGRSYDSSALAAPGLFVPVLFGRRPIIPDFIRVSDAGVYYAPSAEFLGILSEGPIDAVESWGLVRNGTGGGFYGISGAGLSDYFTSYSSGLGDLTTSAVDTALVGVAWVKAAVRIGRIGYPVVMARGVKPYDPRLGAWGAGADPDPLKCAYSPNLALVLGMLLTSRRFGLRVAPTAVDWTSFSSAANLCDETVDGEKRCEVHLQVRAARSLSEWLETLGMHGGLRVREVNGLWRCDQWGKDVVSPIAITSDDLVRGADPRATFGAGGGLRDAPNVVLVEWTDPATWTVRTYTLRHSSVEAGALARPTSPYRLHGLLSEKAAARAAWRIAKQLWSGIEVQLDLMPRFLYLKAGDLLRLTIPELGFAGRDFLVSTVEYSVDRVVVRLNLYDPAAWTPGTITSDSLPGGSVWSAPPMLEDLVDGFLPKITSETATQVVRTIYEKPKWKLPSSYAFGSRVRLRWAKTSCPSRKIVAVKVVAGGSGYAVNDPVTFDGSGSGATARVSAVSSGAITAVEVTAGGSGWGFFDPNATAGGSGTGSALTPILGPVSWTDAAFEGEAVVPLKGDPALEAGGFYAWDLDPFFVGSSTTNYNALGEESSYMESGGPAYVAAMIESSVGVPGVARDRAIAPWASSSTGVVDNAVRMPPGGALTSQKLPVADANGKLVDSKFSDDGTTPKYNGAALAGLASPALTGNPTAPTQTAGDNSTKLATTAYVDAAVAAGGGGGKVLKAQEFTSGTTNFTTAAGVTEVYVTGCGGGGGGARGQSSSLGAGGGGGGGASVYRKKLSVSASTTYSVAIGAGGVGGTGSNGNSGGTGGSTTFGALLTLSGGGGGVSSASGAGGRGGAGGSGGQNGFDGQQYVATYAPTPAGGNGGLSFPGGWGAGGPGLFNANGLAGKGGYLLVEWWE